MSNKFLKLVFIFLCIGALLLLRERLNFDNKEEPKRAMGIVELITLNVA